jgi:hypothetical protein
VETATDLMPVDTAQPRKISLRELEQLVAAGGIHIKVRTPDSWLPATHFLHHGMRPCVRVEFSDGTTLECSIDHKIEIDPLQVLRDESICDEHGVWWVEAQYLSRGQPVKADCGHIVTVRGVVEIGVKEVYDLSIDHDASQGHHRFYANGISTHNCVNCGACDSFLDVKAITKSDGKETGENDFWRIKDVVRDSDPHQKLLIEVRVAPGRYAAIPTRWFRYSVGRALLRASDGLSKPNERFELVEPFISQRFFHSRQGYRLKSDTFKDMLGGSLLIVFDYNSLINMDQAYADELCRRAQKFTTAGWEIRNIKVVSADYVLKNVLDYALITYRFDTRKVNPDLCNQEYLRERIVNFFKKDSKIKYKSQHAQGRFATRVEIKDFDKSRILAMSASVGRNRFETVLRVLGKVEDNHPLIFLAGMLGGDSGAKGYTSLYGVDIEINGFYKAPAVANLFDVFNDGGNHSHSTECVACGGQKMLNIVTGLPYGAADYEQDAYLLKEHQTPVCQVCWAETAA